MNVKPADQSGPVLIIGGDTEGFHNRDLRSARKRIEAGKVYRDASTVIVVPTRGTVPARVVQSWWDLMAPMNNRLVRMFIEKMEVGDAYEQAVSVILDHPAMRDFRYMLTLEEDNLPPPDGLLRLIETIEDGPWDAVGGLYWTKGEGGQPMIYGNPKGVLSFEPQVPKANSVQECNGLGMGFTLFRLDMFRSGQIDRPFFKTVQAWSPQTGGQTGTQDLYFFGKARKAGFRVASDNRVRVGHLDVATGMIW
jgi:hypothetical protein